mmetsp:Transcript_19095/g.44995  ORF Transcript_19095/g.44995 Transcript_19095/m.44995 type:complete len:237 (+) Transcript_19095:151-861(+)
MAHAFGLRNFKHETILKLQRKDLRVPTRLSLPPHEEGTHRSASSFFVPKLIDSRRELLATLDIDSRRQLWAQLPPSERAKDGVLVYCSLAHGTSLRTLYEMCETSGADTRGAIVIVRTLEGVSVFGGYSSAGVRNSRGEPYGTGESFLFACSESDSFVGPAVRAYGWSKQNCLFAHGDSSYWAMGGGRSGGYGLWFDDELYRGSSARCETFELSESLHAEGKEHFRCLVVEVWMLR